MFFSDHRPDLRSPASPQVALIPITRQPVRSSNASLSPMSSANYIPLTQISPDEYHWHPKSPASHARSSLASYFSRRRAILALVAASSVITLFVFLKLSLASQDEFDELEFHVNPLYQPSYIAIPVPDSLPDAARPKLRPVRDLPTECLEHYYVSGLPCHDGQGPVPMDVIWTWVNGSDPLFIDSRTHAANSYAKDDPYRPIKSNNPSRMFRYVYPSPIIPYPRPTRLLTATTTSSDIPSVPCSTTSAHTQGTSVSLPLTLTFRRTILTRTNSSPVLGLGTGDSVCSLSGLTLLGRVLPSGAMATCSCP